MKFNYGRIISMERTLYWQDNKLYLIDQRLLPHKIEYVECKTYQDAIDAIKTMVVRGAPAIGYPQHMQWHLQKLKEKT